MELDHLDVVAAMRDPRGLDHLLKLQEIATLSNDSQADGHKCLGMTEEEALNWPLVSFRCSECGKETGTVCGLCSTGLCEQVACIQAHANEGECCDLGGES